MIKYDCTFKYDQAEDAVVTKKHLKIHQKQYNNYISKQYTGLEMSQISGNETGVPLLRSAGNRFQYRFRFPERSLSVPWIFEFA